MVRDTAHHVADDAAPRVRPWGAIRPVLRPGEARVRAEAGAVDSAPPAADRPGRVRHCVHGDRWQMPQEFHGNRLHQLHPN